MYWACKALYTGSIPVAASGISAGHKVVGSEQDEQLFPVRDRSDPPETGISARFRHDSPCVTTFLTRRLRFIGNRTEPTRVSTMGHVESTPAGTFRAFWRDENDKRHAKTFKRQADARNHITVKEGEVLKGEYMDPKRSRILFSDWIAECRSLAIDLSSSTIEMEEQALRHILPAVGHLPLNKLNDDKIEAYIALKLREGLAGSTVNRHYRMIRKWLNRAVVKGRIRANPCGTVTAPPQGNGVEMRTLTMSELLALSDSISKRYFAWVLVMGLCGPRFSEGNGLRRKHAKVLERKLDIVEQLVYVNAKFERKAHLKTKASRRSISLGGPLADIVATHMADFSNPGNDGLLFPNRAGNPLLPPSFRTSVFKPALVRAGLDPAIRIHDLRHTAAALAIWEGAHPKAIQRRMGHASITMTLDRYGHLFPELDEELSDRLCINMLGTRNGDEVVPFQRRKAS